jgi:hypothetical protein
VYGVDPDDATPGDGDAKQARFGGLAGDGSDRHPQHERDDAENELAHSTGVLAASGQSSSFGLPIDLRSTLGGQLLNSVGKTRGDVLLVVRAELHAGAPGRLDVPAGLLTRAADGEPRWLLLRVRCERRLLLVGLLLVWLRRVGLMRILLRRPALMRLALMRLALLLLARRSRIRSLCRPGLACLGRQGRVRHAHSLARPLLSHPGSRSLPVCLSGANVRLERAYGVPYRLVRVDTTGLSSRNQRQHLRTDILG